MLAERKAIVRGGDPKKAERALRKAAVLVPLCLKEGKPAVLFTVRSHNVSTHKGQVSFPGGHINEGEAAPAAALREAREELGDGLGPITLIARCTAVPAMTGTIVHPVVGFVDVDVGPAPHRHLDLCDVEVARAFALTVDELYDPRLTTRRAGEDPKRGRSGRWPVFLGEPQGAEVWGLTAFILRAVLHQLVTPHRESAGSSSSTSKAGNYASRRLQRRLDHERRRGPPTL
jgi:nudix motif 8